MKKQDNWDWDLEAELNSQEEIKNVNFDLDLIKTKVPTFSSEKLCEMVVCERYLGFNPEIAVMCMEELAIRRIAGDNFIFEDYIDKALNKLPKLNFNMPDLRSVLNNVIKKK